MCLSSLSPLAVQVERDRNAIPRLQQLLLLLRLRLRCCLLACLFPRTFAITTCCVLILILILIIVVFLIAVGFVIAVVRLLVASLIVQWQNSRVNAVPKPARKQHQPSSLRRHRQL